MDHESWRVVIVDDDRVAREVYGAALAVSGRFAVVGEAEDGEQGVSVVGATRPDIVLLDVHMPRLDGVAALPRIREAGGGDTAIVLFSSRPSDHAHEAARSAAAAAVLTKPREPEQLIDDLLCLVGEREPRADEQRVVWTLPAELTSGALARASLRDLREAWRLSEVIDELELLTSELVNNAVVHAHSSVRVAVLRRPDTVRVEVTDSGEGSLRSVDADLAATSGRGLMLVDVVANRWGTRSTASTKTVWFELAAA